MRRDREKRGVGEARRCCISEQKCAEIVNAIALSIREFVAVSC
jgi:hypothetical protein